MLLRNENVIGVVGRDREDGNRVVRERRDEGEQNSGLRERERAFELEADPARRRGELFRDVVGGTHDGEFFGSSADRGEGGRRGPSGDGGFGRLAHDGIEARELAEFEGAGLGRPGSHIWG